MSTWNNWKNVYVDEMKKPIRIIFSMGIIALPAYKKYWSTDLRMNTFPLSSVENELKQYFSFSILVKNLTLITTGLAKFG